MFNRLPPDDPDFDNYLAEFTDQLMEQESDQPVELSIQDPELCALEKTVVQLKELISNAAPEPDLAARIEMHLRGEWEKSETKGAPPPVMKAAPPVHQSLEQLLDKLRWRLAARPRSFALGFAAVAALALVIAVFLSPLSSGGLTGAAGADSSWIALLLGLAGLFILGLLAVWFTRKR
jgi:hypothetical protein